MELSLNIKRKKSKFFEIYILKVLKQVSTRNSITLNAKEQLNSILCNLTKIICDKCHDLTEISRKKTISKKEVLNALLLIIPGELGQNSILEGSKSVDVFGNNNANEKSSRQDKAGILFPPFITEKFLRRFGSSSLMITKTAPICLAAAIEYMTAEMLELASGFAINDKRVRINVRDLELGIRNDEELRKFFAEQNLLFIGAGSIPFIHPMIIKAKNNRENNHIFPGVIALREIKKFQKISNCLTIPRLPFEKYIRQLINTGEKNNIKINHDVFIVIQYFIEEYIVNLLKDSYFIALNSNRIKLASSDIKIVEFIKQGGSLSQPFGLTKSKKDEHLPREVSDRNPFF